MGCHFGRGVEEVLNAETQGGLCCHHCDRLASRYQQVVKLSRWRFHSPYTLFLQSSYLRAEDLKVGIGMIVS